MRNILIALVAAAALGTGCYATGGVAYTGTVTAVDVQPDLVYVSPGVQVIADYDDSIFYSDGFYWRYNGGGWYRSSVHTGGWVVYNSPPSRIVSIREPHRYHRYRPAGYTPRRATVRDHRDHRDHRDRRPAYTPARRDTVRDHRAPVTHQPTRRDTVRDHRAPTTHQPARETTRDHRAPKKKDDDRKRDHRR